MDLMPMLSALQNWVRSEKQLWGNDETTSERMPVADGVSLWSDVGAIATFRAKPSESGFDAS
jgi:hypothetical protein